jgi:hypothetical protein
MRAWKTILGLAGAAALVAGCTVQADSSGGLSVRSAFAEPQTTADFHWQGALAAGQTIEIKGVNGSIDASPSTSGQVEVAAERSGRRSDPNEVKIEVVPHAGGVTICAVYPNPDGPPNECVPGEGGRMRTRNNDVKVSFTVRVPSGVAFTGRTVNGRVEARDLGGDVTAHTVNGSIDVSTTGRAVASTVNGSIRASMGRADWPDDVSFETVNGGITLDLPENVNAEVSARTVNGSISTDFPLTISGRFSNRRLSGTIGNGGRRLELETVNGSIHLRKR